MMDTQTDRMTYRRTRVISIVPPLQHRVTNMRNSYTALNHPFFFQKQKKKKKKEEKVAKFFYDVILYSNVN